MQVEENKEHDDDVDRKDISVSAHIKLQNLSIHGDDILDSESIMVTLVSNRCLLTMEWFDLLADDSTASSNTEESRDISLESTPKLRLRTKSTNETTVADKLEDPVSVRMTSRSDVAVGFVMWSVVLITILVFLCVGSWGWKKSQSLLIPGTSF